jgi:hypothetical protein
VWYFGSSVEHDMDEAEQACGDNAKQARRTQARLAVLDKYLNMTATPTKGRFSDPAARVKAG